MTKRGKANAAAPAEVVSLLLRMANEEGHVTLIELGRRLEEQTGHRLSRATIALMLRRNGVSRNGEKSRLSVIEDRILSGEPVGPFQRSKAMEINPALREHGGDGEGSERGEVLTQTMFPLLPGVSGDYWRWQVHAVVDTWGVVAFADLYPDARMEAAVDLLHGRVLPWYQRHKVRVRRMETNRSRTFTGDEDHAYAVYLRLGRIEHRMRGTESGKAPLNGYMARFKQIVSSEFMLPLKTKISQKKSGITFEQARRQLQEWLKHYNFSHPLIGYRNGGLPPMKFWQ